MKILLRLLSPLNYQEMLMLICLLIVLQVSASFVPSVYWILMFCLGLLGCLKERKPGKLLEWLRLSALAIMFSTIGIGFMFRITQPDLYELFISVVVGYGIGMFIIGAFGTISFWVLRWLIGHFSFKKASNTQVPT